MTKEELQSLIKEVVGSEWENIMAKQNENNQKWMEQLFLRKEVKKEKPNIGRMIRALAAGKGDPEKAAHFAKKQWGDEEIAKALTTSTDETGGGGGFLVPEEYSTELIEYLRPLSVVRTMNPVIVPMPVGSISIPAMTGGATAEYIGEGSNIGVSQPAFGQIKLTWKKLATLVPISNDLIRFSSPQADAIVRDDLVAAMAQREDAAFIRDDGTNDTPKGLRYWIADDNIIPANGTVNLANVAIDLGKAILALEENNIKFLRPGWLISPRTKYYLTTLTDDNGNYVFKDEMAGGTLLNFPFAVTSQIPSNLGTGANESEVYFVDFADAIIGESSLVELAVSEEAAYYNGSSVVAAFSLDQTVIRAIARHDFALRRSVAGAVLTAVKWGA